MVNVEMGNPLSETIFGIPWLVLACVALIVAAAYVVFDTSMGNSGLRWVVLRWFHPLCWVLLTLAAIGKAKITPLPETWAGPIAAAGGVTYLIFAIVWLSSPKG